MGTFQYTPVSLLKELCLQNELDAVYTLGPASGPPHNPRFVYKLKLNDSEVDGHNNSKQRAKHSAAKAMLDLLLAKDGQFNQGFDYEGVLINSETLDGYVESSGCFPAEEPCQGKKPMSDLQEMSVSNHWTLPQYETVVQSGDPHQPTFTMSCEVKGFKEIGVGKSKKIAKHIAAEKMLETLRSQGYERIPSVKKELNREKYRKKPASTSESEPSENVPDSDIKSEASENLPEASEKQPEASENLPEVSEKQPEASEKQPETSTDVSESC